MDSSHSNGPSRRAASGDDGVEAAMRVAPSLLSFLAILTVADHMLAGGYYAARTVQNRPGGAELRGRRPHLFPSSSALGERKRGRAVPK